MKTLVYKRTHDTDPEAGCFGVCDCMGKVRGFNFQAVIGIGAKTPWATECEIDGIVSWIGIGPRTGPINGRGPTLTFDHFMKFTREDAPVFEVVAPSLAARFYCEHPARYVLKDVSDQEQTEIDELLKLAAKAPANHGSRFKASQSRKRLRPGRSSCQPSIC